MRKSQNYEIILYYYQIVLRNLDPGRNFCLDPDMDPGSMNTAPKHCFKCNPLACLQVILR